ncbi:hypothetical protein [Gloeobacter kilaueensis]|uniref:Uncharacterized protein n=1 Tax=Gloeobacter kilaueensis (strain ATCC BAA-2537 / CCAP 1431/1 / ULC 316 / JS1) TaxID=1183438 RepID=U5QQW0_GLOK1|nr:hypothetical protein [Gloeobacter kilaueensis]AGY60029.1 hypothetical protein GKIL_3783 [Gloeobacter kilaueensis JS1]
MMLTPRVLEQALEILGELLAERGSPYGLAVIGGGGLALLGLIDRATRDIDVVARVEGAGYISAEPLPPVLKEAVEQTALLLDLDRSWLNGAPTDLLRFGLPQGFRERALVRRYSALTLQLASRYDQIHFKLFAAVDQGAKSKHFADLKRLQPSTEELLAAARWCLIQAGGIEGDLRAALSALGVPGDVEL